MSRFDELSAAAAARAVAKATIKRAHGLPLMPRHSIDEVLSDPIVVDAMALWLEICGHDHPDGALLDQARRSASGVALNVAEGMGNLTAGKRNYHMNIARGSSFEAAVACKMLGVAASSARQLAIDIDCKVESVAAPDEDGADIVNIADGQ